MILLVSATAAVCAGSVLFTLSLGLRRSVDVVTAWLVVLSAQVCMIVLAVGLARQLRPIPLAIAAVAVSVLQVAWASLRRRAVFEGAGRLREAAAGAYRRPWRHPVLLVLGLLVAAQYAWRLAVAIRLPVLDWDGNYYHLISVDTWVQNAAVTHTPQVVFADTYPQNSELLTAWSATFLHDTSLAGLTQFLFVAMGTAAVVGLARNAGATAARALLAGLVFAATPIVFVQAGTGYVDIAASATVLAAWQLLLSAYDFRGNRHGRSQLTRHFGVAGLAVGMMVGTKSSNLVPAAVAVMVAVCILAAAWHERREPTASASRESPPDSLPPNPGVAVRPTGGGRHRGGGGTAVLTAPVPVQLPAVPARRSFQRYAIVPLLALIVPAVVVGGFWYIRNLVTYGNPVWPVSIPFFKGQGSVSELLNSNLPPELAKSAPLTQMARSWAADLYPHSFIYDQRLGGFGPQWLLLLVPAIAVMVFGFLRDRVVYLVGLLVPFGVLLLMRPEPWWTRYTLFLAGLGAVCYVLAVQWLAGRWERLLNGALALLVAVGMWWATSPMYVAAGNPPHPLTPAQTVQLLRADYATRMSAPYPWSGYGPILGAPPGTIIAVPDRDTLIFTHPYVGTRLERRLVVIPTPDDIDALYSSLGRTGADYVVLNATHPGTAKLARDALRDHRFGQVGTTFDGLLFIVR